MHLRAPTQAHSRSLTQPQVASYLGVVYFLGLVRVTQSRTMGRRIIMDEPTQSSSRGRTGEPCAVSKVVAADNGTPHGRVLHVYLHHIQRSS